MVNKTVVAIIPGCVSPKIVLTTAEIAQTDQTVIKLDQNEISCVILFHLPNINTWKPICVFLRNGSDGQVTLFGVDGLYKCNYGPFINIDAEPS